MTKHRNNNPPTKATQGNGLGAEEQQVQMATERAFLAKLLESALAGNGPDVKKHATEYGREHGIPPHEVLSEAKDGSQRTAVHFACQSIPQKTAAAGEDIIPQLLEWIPPTAVDASVRSKDKDGLTPLMLAAQNPDASLSALRVRSLLSHGGSKLALARSHAGATALHYASSASHANPSVLKLLVEHGKGTVSTASLKGGMPLHWACASGRGRDEGIKCLIEECGADVDARNEQGLTPLILAIAAVNEGYAVLLVGNGADCGLILSGNVTVFHMASDLGMGLLLKMLLEKHGGEREEEGDSLATKCCEMKNSEGKTPLDLAAQDGHVECVVLLLQHGSSSDTKVTVEDAKECIKKAKEVLANSSTTSNDIVPTPKTNDPKDEKDPVEALAEQLAIQAILSSKTTSSSEKEASAALKATGNSFYVKKDWESAIESYTAAIDMYPGDATYYSNRSACFLNLEQAESALKDGIVAQRVRPDWSKACYRVAVARLALERYEDAAVAAWEGLQLDQENEELKGLLQKCVKKGKQVHQKKKGKEGI